jgi:hypothetical protein
MKTPREILLNKHRAAQPALDFVRQRVVESELGRAETMGEALAGSGWLTLLWQQLVQPCRSAWVGLAAAWCRFSRISRGVFMFVPPVGGARISWRGAAGI